MSYIESNDWVIDFDIAVIISDSTHPRQLRISSKDETICKLKDATRSYQVPLPEEARRTLELQRTLNRYNGMIHALEDLQKSIAKIEKEALPNITRENLDVDIAHLNQLLSVLKITRALAQNQYDDYLDKCSEDEH